MFLSSDNIKALTGYTRPTDQRRWLVANGYRFDVRADGRPSVLVAQVEARQLRGLKSLPEPTQEPNLAALET